MAERLYLVSCVAKRVADLPGGGRRTIRRPVGVHGVFCNGVEVFDGADYVTNGRGPGQVLDRFASSSAFRRAKGEGATPDSRRTPPHVGSGARVHA